MVEKKLKTGYSTGSHATSALKAGLIALLKRDDSIKKIDITIPDNISKTLKINEVSILENFTRVNVIKSDNDDIDATKNCKISCFLSFNKLPVLFNEINHNPYIIQINKHKLTMNAGKGLGIVTKEGLAPPAGFPAINPVPLQMMEKAFEEVIEELKPEKPLEIFVVFCVENGEEIAKNTANKKVGVLGGISFIGKKGIVKPISTDAYLHSLESEISVASKSSSREIVLTMGNSSLDFAKNFYKLPEENFVEIGNYVFDTLNLLKNYEFEKISISANIGKMTKIAQGKKNTNNRFGDIDFNLLSEWLKNKDFPEEIIDYCKDSSTVKAIEDFIKNNFSGLSSNFYEIISENTLNCLLNWSKEIALKKTNFEVVLNDGINLKILHKA